MKNFRTVTFKKSFKYKIIKKNFLLYKIVCKRPKEFKFLNTHASYLSPDFKLFNEHIFEVFLMFLQDLSEFLYFLLKR